MKVLVPKKVAEAFDYYKETCKNMSKDTLDLTLMAIPFSPFSKGNGQALILKEFAKESPTLYLQAIANGYEATIDLEEEVEQLLSLWLNKGYVGDEKANVRNFAKVITNHIKQNL
ncbi:hypothetical protein NSA56_11400 [Oceanobacillus caeni]|uniref:hypothetical protein n=1 Tax=Oceanobacillus caeni TaxID=405946 RepID=UPI00214A82AE|nr:hypothetical protein [Oceanobacillus caeni]MCR1835001.1 hypothetical protein [Oceanobacillus caeni]